MSEIFDDAESQKLKDVYNLNDGARNLSTNL